MQFSINQAPQLYVVKAVKNKASDATGKVTYNSTDYGTIAKAKKAGETITIGDARIGKTADGKSIYVEHVGANGLITRSDLIDIDKILWGNVKTANQLSEHPRTVTVTIADSPVAGEDYILDVIIRGAYADGDRVTLVKFGAVHAVANMTASNFYLALAKSIRRNFNGQDADFLTVSLATASDPVEVDDVNGTYSGTYTGVILTGKEQFWALGTFEERPVLFTVSGHTIIDDNEEVNPWVFDSVGVAAAKAGWGDAKEDTSVYYAFKNSHKVADLEYFCMKGRADLYGMVSWPNYVPTTYLVDPSAVNGYDIVTLHYAYIGSNESVQKSEKTLLLVVPAGSGSTVKGAINTVAGATVVD